MNDKSAKPTANDKSAKRTANATVVLAWLTGFLVIAGIGNVFYLQRQIHEAQESGVTSTRAWMAVQATSFEYSENKDGPTSATGHVIVMNTGPTPAFNIHLWRCAEVRPNDPSENELQIPKENCLQQDIGMAGKDIPIKLNGSVILDQATKDSLSADSNNHAVPHFYMWGTITYDIAVKDRKHFTSFCLLNGVSQLGACVKGNNGD